MALATWSGRHRARAAASRDLPRARLALIFAILIGIAMLPILIFPMPFMADYPNHLARIYAIGALGHDTLLARYYEIDWRLVPDLAVDAIVPLLAKAAGIFAAGKLFVLLTLTLLATGPIALHHALYRRIDLWPLTAFLFLYNTNFFYGLLNYLFATALALWATAAWIWLRDKGPVLRAVISWLFIAALFFSHFLAVGIYGMAIGCYELWHWRATRLGPRAVARDAAVLLTPFLLVMPLTLASPTVGFAEQTEWMLWPGKALGIYFIFKSYSRSLAVVLGLVLGGALLWGLLTRRVRLHPAGLLFVVLAAIVYLAMPAILMSARLVDVRLPATFVLFLIGMSGWEHRTSTEAKRFAAALVALVGLVMVEVIGYWAQYQPALARIEHSFARIPPGSRVLVAVNEVGSDHTDGSLLLHLPALVVIERSAFYSHAFTHPAKQPLQVKAPYRANAPYDGLPLPVEELAIADGDHAVVPPPEPGNTDLERHYWMHWRQDYDYLYVLYTPEGYRPPLAGIEPLERNNIFSLYRIAPAP
ncbi:MAG TPA: hypothetical protein VF502_18550 [Stellaceae bacterium]